MCSGALLARAGYHVGVCDRLNTVGGRTRTQIIESYPLPRGAVSFRLGGVLPTLCEEVGAEFEVRPRGYDRLAKTDIYEEVGSVLWPVTLGYSNCT